MGNEAVSTIIKPLLLVLINLAPAIVKKTSIVVDCVKPGVYTFNFENFSTRVASYWPS